MGPGIYTIALYRVRLEGVDEVRQAIEEFVRYVRANELDTGCISLGNGKTIRLASYIVLGLRSLLTRFMRPQRRGVWPGKPEIAV